MQRSPARKSPRVQTAAGQHTSEINLVDAALTPREIVPSETNSDKKTKSKGAVPKAVLTGNKNNIISNEVLPPLVPGPCINLQSQAPTRANLNADVALLQRQIEMLQAQLSDAQHALRVNSATPAMSADISENENAIECRGTTSYSALDPSCRNQHQILPTQQQVLPTQHMNHQYAMPSMPIQRKLYDLPEFYGAPEDWPMFLSAFEHSTAACIYSDFENCLRLQKALKGEAKECVKSLLIHPNNVPTVIEQLKLQYGRPEVLIRCQLQQIKDIQSIGEIAVDKLIPFSIKVRNLVSFLETASGQQHLSNPTLMDELVQKLPMSKRLDWAQFASTLQHWPTVCDFSSWLQRVANLVRSIQTSNTVVSRPVSDQKRKVVLHAVDDQRKQSCHMCKANHKIFDCKKFISLSVPDRWTEVKKLKLCFSCLGGGHSSKDCRRRKQCLIENCQRKHNKLLHDVQPSIPSNNTDITEPSCSRARQVLNCVSHMTKKCDVLFRVLPVVLYGPNCAVETFALLDEGSSITMMDSTLVRQLGLQGRQSQLNLSWYGGKGSHEPAVVVDLHVSSTNKKRKYALKNVFGVSNLKLPSQTVSEDLLKDHALPIRSYEFVAPKVLIGLDHCHLGLPDEIVPLDDAGPYAANTPLGWVVFGNIVGGQNNNHSCLLTTESDSLHNLVANYFETENFGVKALPTIKSEENLRAEKILESSTIRVAGRFQSRLLWSNDDVVLPDSYSMALNRLYGIERKMKNNAEFSIAYRKTINEYFEKNYARKLPLNEIETMHPRTWYLPHFGVFNPNKPGKLRMVFDAAAQTEGVSLNSKLLKGPQQLNPLPSVLFNFRVGAVAVCGDIKEMFHQIVVADEDRCSQRFLWRENDSDPPEIYEMLVMTFGAACSPSIADYVKKKNALEFQDRFPRAVESIIDHHYVDDFVDSFSSPSEAVIVAEQVREIHKAAGFEMRNYTSNSSEVVVALEGKLNQPISFSNWFNESESSTEKILGMFWDPSDDTFKFILKFHRVENDIINGSKCPTKREFLCIVMSIFDPIGFLSHFMITAKLIMREVWRHGIRWDEKLPVRLEEMWINWRRELENIVQLKIPRYYFVDDLPTDLELHIFVDASEDAFSAVAYWRYTSAHGNVAVSFISAKTKCAPLKTMTIPRLELQAAVLDSRLMCTILKEHKINVSRRLCWSDSTTVINWIGSESRRYKPFVAHRITEILDSTRPSDWRWLPTKFNVADEATRFKRKIEFDENTRWFQGPQFLYQSEDYWPENYTSRNENLCEEELRPRYALLVSTNLVIDFDRFSSFLRLNRTMAWVLRFISCSQKKEGKIVGCLSATELKVAETVLCRLSQNKAYSSEIQILKAGGTLPKNHDLYKLCPYLDDYNLLRVSGRIDAASWLPFDTKRPIILSPSHRLTKLFVAHVHNKMKHQNFEATMGEIRRKFWVPQLRRLLRKTVQECYVCRFNNAAPITPIMGLLPDDRVTPFIRPFTYTGLDYFGPINITVGRHHEKRWVALFTCLTIRAVHLEVAHDLSTDACILAIRNFINRRGTPLRMRSDNGKNFIGVSQEAKRFKEVFDVMKIGNELSAKGIEWKFNCPLNPSEGGIWERMVQSVKKVLKVTLKEVAPKEHTLQSFLIEAENILNSRPLTHLPVSHEDEEPLTPNHFLLGSANTVQTPSATEIERLVVTRKQWRIARQLRDHFWKRWIIEYLPTLTRRSKWCQYTKPMVPGDLVLICDPAVSRRDWKRGRIIKVYPGNDGVVRRVDVQTSSGSLRRPVSKVAVLDLE